jgi:hypothetical protein
MWIAKVAVRLPWTFIVPALLLISIAQSAFYADPVVTVMGGIW